MDILQLYHDFSVDHLTEGHKHCREGWVNTPCPFCTGNPGYHLGFNLEGNYYFCWRCGWHPAVQTVSKLINLPEREVYSIIKNYGLIISKPSKTLDIKIRKKEYRMPSNTMPLTPAHKKYLENRKFDPDKLIREWALVATGVSSVLDDISYARRIIIPVVWESRAVSFTSRDVTGKHLLRYIACPKDRELIPHKDILYGDQEKWKDTGICVEGPTDVWRLGSIAFATFGIKYTPRQVRIMAKTFKRILVFFDSDPQAIIQAHQLVADLRFRGVDCETLTIPGDPGSMKQEEADYLVKQLMK